MSNELENFINNNREEFDSEEMRNGAWEKLQNKLSEKNKMPGLKTSHFWWAAAAILIISLSGIVYFTVFKSANNEQIAINKVALPPKELIDAVDTSYTSQMYLFAELIQIKQLELKKNQKKHPRLYRQFLKDDNQLDSSYNYLKSELSANPNKEVLLEAMIQNLQLKVELLTRQLQIIQQSKNKKTKNENKTI